MVRNRLQMFLGICLLGFGAFLPLNSALADDRICASGSGLQGFGSGLFEFITIGEPSRFFDQISRNIQLADGQEDGIISSLDSFFPSGFSHCEILANIEYSEDLIAQVAAIRSTSDNQILFGYLLLANFDGEYRAFQFHLATDIGEILSLIRG